MNQLFSITALVFTIFLFSNQQSIQAQYSFGVEAGGLVSSLITLDQPYPVAGSNSRENLTAPVVGGTAGVFLERDFKENFALKVGLFSTLKGAYMYQNFRWNLLYLTTPILAVFTPVKPLKIGVGIEVGAVVYNNARFITDRTLSVGARTEIAWQINEAFRLIAHGTLDFTPTHIVLYTDDQGVNRGINRYRNVTGGLSLAYIIKTFK